MGNFWQLWIRKEDRDRFLRSWRVNTSSFTTSVPEFELTEENSLLSGFVDITHIGRFYYDFELGRLQKWPSKRSDGGIIVENIPFVKVKPISANRGWIITTEAGTDIHVNGTHLYAKGRLPYDRVAVPRDAFINRVFGAYAEAVSSQASKPRYRQTGHLLVYASLKAARFASS